MEIPNTKNQSQFSAERRIKTLASESIFEGKVRDSDTVVILKTYGKSALTSSQKAKWESGVKTVSKFKHLGLAEIIGQEMHESGPLLAFKVPPGAILFEWLSNAENLSLISLKGRIALLKTLAEAIGSIHDSVGPIGSIHLGNIFVSTKSNRMLVIDPGIAHRAHLAINSFSPIVTPFLAPEVITGGAPTIESDVFSFAAITFLLLTDSKPFSGENSNSIVSSMLSYKTPNISDYIKGASPRVSAVFSRAFSSNPSLRSHSVQEFFRDLEETLASCGVLSTLTSSTDFHKGNASEGSRSKASVLSKAIDLRILFVVLLIGSLFLVYLLNTPSDPSNEQVKITISDSVEKTSAEVLDPLNFQVESLPKLNESEIIELLSHPLTSEGLAMAVVAEATDRSILLRPELFGAALKSPYYRVKIAALKALERSGQAANLSVIVLDLSTDEDPLVRGFAARTLGQIGGRNIVSGIEQWLQKEEDPQVQGVLRSSLNKIGTRGN